MMWWLSYGLVWYRFVFFFFLRIRRPPRSTQIRSSAASDVYKRQIPIYAVLSAIVTPLFKKRLDEKFETGANTQSLSLIHISEPMRPY